jgi:hypothetical protein
VPKSLAEIAIDARLASRATVVAAAQLADQKGIPLVVALVRDHAVDELALVAALRRQARVPLTDPESVKLDGDALREVPRDVCRRLRVLPLALALPQGGLEAGPRRLSLAMADPTDAVAVAEVEHLTGCTVEPTLMPLSAVEELVEHGYRSFVTEVMRREPKVPFGAGLAVETQRMPRYEDAAAPPQPTTTPFHRLSDDADLALRHQALLKLLVARGVITEDEYEEEVRQSMKRRDGDR